MLLLPLILGAGLAGIRPSAAWLVPPAVVLVFLAHCALVPVVQRRLRGRPAALESSRPRAAWTAAYLLGAAFAFAAAFWMTPAPNRSWLLVVSAGAALGGAIYTSASCAGAGRRVVTELVGMAAISLSAPIMALASGSPVDERLPAASVMAFAYSASTLAFVRAYGRLERAGRDAVLGCVAAHVVLFGGLALIGTAGWLSPWWVAAFAPVAGRTAWGLARPARSLRQLGRREIWVASSFTLIATVIVAA
jgi:hypothetical protein